MSGPGSVGRPPPAAAAPAAGPPPNPQPLLGEERCRPERVPARCRAALPAPDASWGGTIQPRAGPSSPPRHPSSPDRSLPRDAGPERVPAARRAILRARIVPCRGTQALERSSQPRRAGNIAARACIPRWSSPGPGHRPPRGSGANAPVPSLTMFERTALPEGPRVISAPLERARSVSIAAYVLAGSRLESPAQAGVAHFMEHLTFKGTARFPSTRAISEAIEGVGGSFNAATDRESTVYWVRVPRRVAERAMEVIGELIVRPSLDEKEIDNERGGDHRGDPFLPRRSGRIQPDPLPAGDVRRWAARPRDLRRRSGHPCPSRVHDPRLLVDDVPAREHRGGRIGRPGSRGECRPRAPALRHRQRDRPGLRARAAAAGRGALRPCAPRHDARPTSWSGYRRCSGTTRIRGRCRS